MTDATNAARWALYGPAILLGALVFVGQGDLAASIVNRAFTGAGQFLDHLAPDEDRSPAPPGPPPPTAGAGEHQPDELSSPTPFTGEGNAPGPDTGPPPTGAGCTTSCVTIHDPDGTRIYPHTQEAT